MSSSPPDSDGTVDRTVTGLVDAPSMTRYDLVLAVIPLAFVASLFVDTLLAAPTPLAMAVAGVLGGLAVVDALFVNPPT